MGSFRLNVQPCQVPWFNTALAMRKTTLFQQGRDGVDAAEATAPARGSGRMGSHTF